MLYARIRNRWRTALVAAALAAAVVPAARAGVLHATSPACAIAFDASPPPAPFLAGPADFSVVMWIRRTTDTARDITGVLNAGGVVRLGIDDNADGLRFEMLGGSASIDVLVPLRDDGPEPKVPVDEWMLVAASWDAAAARLTGWAQSETLARVTATGAAPGWTGPVAWPVTLGATAGRDSFTGQLGLTVIRDHRIDEDDLDTLWRDGAPYYFGPALTASGMLSGFDGVSWMIGHGVITDPWDNVNSAADGAILGGPVTLGNVLVYNDLDASGFFSAGDILSVSGSWQLESPHDEGQPWSGFFERERPALGLAESAAARVSPAARALALDTPAGLVRVAVSANSRGVRFGTGLYGGLENWAHGGLVPLRRASLAGVMVPAAYIGFGPWLGFRDTARAEGTVFRSRDTPLASVAFGNFGTQGEQSPWYPEYTLGGAAIVIEDGASYIPKARPEPGTLFADAALPMTVRAMVLRFPGSGKVLHRGEKAATQVATTVTQVGTAISTDLDTTVVTRALEGGDAVDPGARTITIGALVPGIEPGQACYVTSGPGTGGISVITEIDVAGGHSMVLTLERWLPVDPVPGASELAFGPLEPVWIEHAWSGLAAGDPEVYRGVRLTASGGPVAVLFLECSRPGADGFVIGGVGQSGAGYDLQLDRLLDAAGLTVARGLAPDVWLQFFAHQGSAATSMDRYTAAIRAVSPDTEVWWIGDPDLDTTGDDVEGTDAWQAYILDNAAAAGVGAIVAQESALVGTGAERAADGQTANQSHLSARGCERYVAAVLDQLAVAALPAPAACPADVDGNGGVEFADLLAVLAAWGPCPPPCPADLDGNGNVEFTDLLTVLAAWGPCPPA